MLLPAVSVDIAIQGRGWRVPTRVGDFPRCLWCKLFVSTVCLWLMPFLTAIPGNEEVTLLTGREQ